MEKKINVDEIMKELEEQIRNGLSTKSATLTDISIMIGKTLEKTKEKIMQDASEIINNEVESNEKLCECCQKPLKKTTN